MKINIGRSSRGSIIWWTFNRYMQTITLYRVIVIPTKSLIPHCL